MSTEERTLEGLPRLTIDSEKSDDRKIEEVEVPKDVLEEGSVDPIYQAKSRIISKAIQEIGMGRYQIFLFQCAGFGAFAGSLWPAVASLILGPVLTEFAFNAPFLPLALIAGKIAGALFWSFGCDIWGRRWTFNTTLLVAGAFAVAAGGSQNFVTLASLFAAVCFGSGGTLAIDGVVLLDLLPASHQYLLTLLSVWWAISQLVGTLVSWPLLANFSCPSTATTCIRSENMGWRYLLFTLGGLQLVMWGIRFFIFKFLESPRYLVAVGKDAEAVKVIHKLARYNGTTSTLTLEQLSVVGTIQVPSSRNITSIVVHGAKHVRALYRTRRMGFATTLLLTIRGTISLATTLYGAFLPFILNLRGLDLGDGSLNVTYRNLSIIAVVGIPSSLLAAWMVEWRSIGRKGTLATSAALTGATLLASTTSRSSNALLGWNCAYTFFGNIMLAVMYALSTEIFPAIHRGTGNGLVTVVSFVFAIIAPVIALYANITTAVPVYIAGALHVFAGLLTLLLPYEPRGKTSI
ncbi:MFS general substrate transporter [Marasmius fiardii PR-910]|nr:MFS general substrate transporter [Marasmius fiardii PR-910]